MTKMHLKRQFRMILGHFMDNKKATLCENTVNYPDLRLKP